MKTLFRLLDLGKCHYFHAYEFQQKLFDENILLKTKGLSTVNTFIICEHPHVITIGKNARNNNLLVSGNFLKENNIEFYKTDRGGDITYHGPGQLVVYPVIDLENYSIGLKEYIYRLEEVMIRLLNRYNIRSFRYKNGAGVWLDVDNPGSIRKIGAVGVRSSRFITMHGFALNVNTDLSYFQLINPCGFTNKAVSSIANELGSEIDIQEVKLSVHTILKGIFLI